jgi:hypothetical protein
MCRMIELTNARAISDHNRNKGRGTSGMPEWYSLDEAKQRELLKGKSKAGVSNIQCRTQLTKNIFLTESIYSAMDAILVNDSAANPVELLDTMDPDTLQQPPSTYVAQRGSPSPEDALLVEDAEEADLSFNSGRRLKIATKGKHRELDDVREFLERRAEVEDERHTALSRYKEDQLEISRQALKHTDELVTAFKQLVNAFAVPRKE